MDFGDLIEDTTLLDHHKMPGLFVAGDVDGGLPQSYLGGALAMGGLIGEEATHFAQGNDMAAQPANLKAWLRKEAEVFEAPLRRERGIPTTMVEYKARSQVQYYLKPKEGMERKSDGELAGDKQDRYDKKNLGFHSQVETNYRTLSRVYWRIWNVIDASPPEDEVFNTTIKLLEKKKII